MYIYKHYMLSPYIVYLIVNMIYIYCKHKLFQIKQYCANSTSE